MRRGHVLSEFDRLRREEMVATIPGAVDIGIGPNLIREAGIPSGEISKAVLPLFGTLVDGISRVKLYTKNGVFRVYIVKSKRKMEVGNRSDCSLIGFNEAAEELDRILPD